MSTLELSAREQTPTQEKNLPEYAARGSEGRIGRRLRDIVPGLLLFTPYTETTRRLWTKSVKVDISIKRPAQPIPEIDGSRFTFDALKRATNNFVRQPAVVRGLFKDTPAVEKWTSLEYLPSTSLGDLVLPIIKNATHGTAQLERETLTFRDAFLDVVENKVMKYIFFPVQSRFDNDVVDQKTREQMQKSVNELVRQDLDVDRIWPGFAGPKHGRFLGSQLVIGYGHRTPEKTTGTGWHCAFSNNFFVQVAGRKRWYLISPKMSRYLFPIRHGVNTMMTGTTEMNEIQQHIPMSYVDLDPGDMLYNPFWQWHSVMNYEGLSIGVPMREMNILLARRNNRLYTNVALVNNLALRVFKRDIGGYGTI